MGIFGYGNERERSISSLKNRAFDRLSRQVCALFAIFIAAALTACLCPCAMSTESATASDSATDREKDTLSTEKIVYPNSEKSDAVDKYNGHSVPDPYRWLEDTGSEKTKEWVSQQNSLTRSVLDQIPARKAIHQRLTELWNYERYSLPLQLGDFLFFYKNNGLQNRDVLFVQDKSGKRRVLLDPNQLSSGGSTIMTDCGTTCDGKLMAYGVAKEEGSGWLDWYVKDVASGKDLPDHLKLLTNTSAAWTHDGKGFYYYCSYHRKSYPVNFVLPGRLQLAARRRIFYHALGTAQSADKLVYGRKGRKGFSFSPTITNDGRYLIVSEYQGRSTQNGLAIQDLQDPTSALREVVPIGQSMCTFVGNENNNFFFITNQGAPKGKVISRQFKGGALAKPKEVIAESANTLDQVFLLRDNLLICNYMKDAASIIEVHDLSGKFIKQLELPGIGSVSGFYGTQSDKTTYFKYQSYSDPGTIFSINLDDFSRKTFFQPNCAFNTADFTTEQIFFTSKDGTKIPMAISYKKGLVKDGHNPTYLYGYGGFEHSLLPTFSVRTLTWMDRGGIYAVPALRGGGEYGESWHLAGMKHNKQNVFDDFIAAAQALIDQKYTSVERLAIGGGSNGGLLVGACMTQRPDLFAAALPSVGVMDMLRLNRWKDEYGSAENADDFPILLRYSPLHNLKKGVCYPATLLCTAENDHRVVPAHSYKFAAALQDAQGCNKPILIRIDAKGGHGMVEATDQIIDGIADRWAFLELVLNAPSPS